MDFEKDGFLKLRADDFPLFAQYYDKMKQLLPSSLHFTSMNT